MQLMKRPVADPSETHALCDLGRRIDVGPDDGLLETAVRNQAEAVPGHRPIEPVAPRRRGY